MLSKKNRPGVWSVRKMGPGMEEMATEAFFGMEFLQLVFVFLGQNLELCTSTALMITGP